LTPALRTTTKGSSSVKRAVCWALIVLIVFTCLAVVLTYPLVSNLSHDYFDPTVPHDGIGTIAAYWWRNYARINGQSGTRTTFWNYPFGYDTHDFTLMADPLSGGPLLVMTRVIGAQAAYNILIILSFPLAGLLMFLLIYYITGSTLGSLIGAFIYAFSPWHVARAYNQVSLAMIYVLPLFLIAVIYLWRKRSVLSALAVAAALAVAILTDLHFGLFCGLILISWGIAAFVNNRVETKRFIGRGQPLVKRQTLRIILMAVLAVVLALAISAPILRNVFYKDPTVIADTGERSIDTTVNYSSRLWNYVVPPAFALIWRSWSTDYVFEHENLAGSSEMTAYPGIVTYALAIVAIFLTFRRRRLRGESSSDGGDEEHDAGPGEAAVDAAAREDAAVTARTGVVNTAVYFAIIAGVLAFILSMPPIIKIGSTQIPTPSIIMRAIAPFFRFYSRWALVVNFALALLAGIGFYLLRGRCRWSRVKAAAICLLVIALFTIDVTIQPPLQAHDSTKVPKAVTDLARYPKDQPVVYYPLTGQYAFALHYHYYQTFNEHPMMNHPKPGTIGNFYQGVLKDIYAPYTPQMLAGLGIKKAVVIPGFFKLMTPVGITFDPAKMPAGYKLIEKNSDSYLYDITAEPAKLFPLYYTNFSGSVILEDGQAWSALLRPSGEFLIQNKDGPTTRTFSVTLDNHGPESTVSMDLDGKSLGSTRIRTGVGTLAVPLQLTKKQQVLTIHWDGQPTKTDGKTLGINGTVDVYLLLSRPQF
jgi:hypothetical protein